jgi:hypothetical protein
MENDLGIADKSILVMDDVVAGADGGLARKVIGARLEVNGDTGGAWKGVERRKHVWDSGEREIKGAVV